MPPAEILGSVLQRAVILGIIDANYTVELLKVVDQEARRLLLELPFCEVQGLETEGDKVIEIIVEILVELLAPKGPDFDRRHRTEVVKSLVSNKTFRFLYDGGFLTSRDTLPVVHLGKTPANTLETLMGALWHAKQYDAVWHWAVATFTPLVELAITCSRFPSEEGLVDMLISKKTSEIETAVLSSITNLSADSGPVAASSSMGQKSTMRVAEEKDKLDAELEAYMAGRDAKSTDSSSWPAYSESSDNNNGQSSASTSRLPQPMPQVTVMPFNFRYNTTPSSSRLPQSHGYNNLPDPSSTHLPDPRRTKLPRRTY